MGAWHPFTSRATQAHLEAGEGPNDAEVERNRDGIDSFKDGKVAKRKVHTGTQTLILIVRCNSEPA